VKASATPSVWLLAFVPLLFAAMCLPMALDWIGPNGFYGVRIEATRVSDVEWYRINRIAGIAGVVAGLGGFLANLAGNAIRHGGAAQAGVSVWRCWSAWAL
jgi:uncharacterized membrane protein